ncbi:MAG: HAD-IA family hydrolase [Cyanobacteria bacterium Co-bin13]|nr:HAD-IA family hydrolase [Cyanobacteria bacterium Co-bin13]
MGQPKVIFLDAVGTLFGVQGSVGEAYARVAGQFGVACEAPAVDQAFFAAFKAADPMAFPDSEPTDVPHQEYLWWEAIARQTFDQVGVLPQFASFDDFFARLYAHFATAEPWFVYPDTLNSLQRWRAKGIELGVLSNFDSRIYSVLDVLGLADYFQSVTISTEVGAPKPDPLIFATALQKHHCTAKDAWHVGDSYKEDYQGATAAGLKGIWLNRQRR